MKKEEKEDKKDSPKREDYLLMKEKLLEKEKLTVKNGLKQSETTFQESILKPSNKVLLLKSWKDKSNDTTI
jgi:hypothetical protein